MTQVDITTFKNNTSTLYPDNTSGEISPADLRAQMFDIADSAAFINVATIPPDADDDAVATGGNGAFEVGHLWVNTATDTAYVCLDNTATAAIWVQIGGDSDVTASGTTAANEVAVWTGDGIIDGASSLIWTGTALGVGQATPTQLLHMRSATPVLRIEDEDDNTFADIAYDAGSLTIGADGGAGAALSSIRFNIDNAEVGRFDVNGRLGIGQTIPLDLLHVAGSSEPALRLEDTDVAGYTRISATPIGAGLRLEADPSNVAANSTIQFYIDDIEQARWDGADLEFTANGRLVGATQFQSENTTTFRRLRPTESGYSIEMNNAAANTIEILGDKDFTITGATQANPVVITVASTAELETGDTGTIAGVVGMTELNGGGPYTITVINGTTFSLDGVDGTGFTAYTSGGTFTRDGLVYPEGFYCEIIQTGAGTTTLEAGAFVELNGTAGSPGGPTGDLTAQYGVVTLRKISTGGWVAAGDIGAIA